MTTAGSADVMQALDGNAIAGLLEDLFGMEMTTARSVCAGCGATRPAAELVVYLRAPGTVVRCRSCERVLMVFVAVRGVTCVDLNGLDRLEPAGASTHRRLSDADRRVAGWLMP